MSQEQKKFPVAVMRLITKSKNFWKCWSCNKRLPELGYIWACAFCKAKFCHKCSGNICFSCNGTGIYKPHRKDIKVGNLIEVKWPSETGEQFYPRAVVVDLENRLKKALKKL